MAVLSLLAFSGSSLPVRLCRSLEEIAGLFRLDSFSTSPTKFNEADLVPLTARSLATRSYDQAAEMSSGTSEFPIRWPNLFGTATRENISRWDDLRAWWAMLR